MKVSNLITWFTINFSNCVLVDHEIIIALHPLNHMVIVLFVKIRLMDDSRLAAG